MHFLSLTCMYHSVSAQDFVLAYNSRDTSSLDNSYSQFSTQQGHHSEAACCPYRGHDESACLYEKSFFLPLHFVSLFDVSLLVLCNATADVLAAYWWRVTTAGDSFDSYSGVIGRRTSFTIFP